MSKLRTNSIVLMVLGIVTVILGIVTMILGILSLEGRVDLRITMTSLSLCIIFTSINCIFILVNYKKQIINFINNQYDSWNSCYDLCCILGYMSFYKKKV